MSEVSISELDTFRERYRRGDLSFEEHVDFYDLIVQVAPEQNYWSLGLVNEFLQWAQPRLVFELGGWDGGLADAVLLWHPGIQAWVNQEIARVPQVCTDPRYSYDQPDTWAWSQPIDGFDAVIASHVLEHLTVEHLSMFLRSLAAVNYAYVDVPLPEKATNWMGTTTTHILDLSISEFDGVWEDFGWEIVQRSSRDGKTKINGRTSGVPSYVRFLRRHQAA